MLATKEPGGTPAGELIRTVFLDPAAVLSPQAELLLVNASRAQLVRDVIVPALERGETVLCDRYTDSSIAYQGYGRGLGIDLVERICRVATGGLMPQRTLLIDVSCETSRARVGARAGRVDRVEAEDEAFHHRVREGFARMAIEHPQRIIRIDGELAPDHVYTAARSALESLL